MILAACVKLLKCALCNREIDGEAVLLGTPPLIEGMDYGVCQDCKSDPSCKQCQRHPHRDNVAVVSVEGDDIADDTRWCTECIAEFKNKGYDVHEVGRRPTHQKRETVIPSPNPTPKKSEASFLKILPGGKNATDKSWADDAPPVKRKLPPSIELPRERKAEKGDADDEMISISKLNKRDRTAKKAMKKASAAWWETL